MTANEAWIDGGHEEKEILRAAHALGFRVFFIDGNEENLDRSNLSLTYRYDHILHREYVGSLSAERKPREKPVEYVKQPTKGSATYRLKLGGLSWMAIAKQLGITAPNACRLARCHAKSNSLPWPIKQAVGG